MSISDSTPFALVLSLLTCGCTGYDHRLDARFRDRSGSGAGGTASSR